MSKNLTRKGLALGAVVALGSSLFAGTPATAAPTALYLESAFGTSTTGVLGQYFTLALSAQAGTTDDEIKFYVEGVAAADVSAVARSVATKDASASTTAYDKTPTETDVSTSLKQVAYSTKDTSNAQLYDAGKYFELALKVNSTNVTSTTSVKVTPFLDSVVADGKPGTGELTGTAVTINFVKGSELTATPTITATTFGATAKASVSVSGGVNVEQFRAAGDGGHGETPFTVLFKENGTDEGSANNALYDITDKTLVAASTATVAAGDIWGAKAKINGTDSVASSTATAAAGEVASMTALAGKAGTSFKSTYGSTNNVIRAGSGTYKVATTVTAVDGKSKVGQKVTFTFKESDVNTLAAAATVTAGGKTLKNTDSTVQEELSVDVLSDADGVATLELTYAGIVHGNTVNVAAKANGASAVITPTTTTNVTFTGQDSVATAIVDPIDRAQAGTAARHIVKGGAFSIAYTVVDQFGQVPTGTFRIVATNSGADNVPSITSPVAVSAAGAVTLVGTDNSVDTDDYTVTATLQKLGTDGTYAGLTSAVTETSTISVGTAKTPATVAITATTTADIVRNGNALTAGSYHLEQGSISRSFAANSGQTMSAVVTDSTGAPVPGAAVTFTGTGVLFQAGGTIRTNDGTFGLGSITVYTNTSGQTGNVFYYSNNTGKQTITVTSGAATKTQAISWAAVTDGGSAWTVDAPVRVLPGTTLKVSAVLKDKYGALVNSAAGDIKVTYTGPGYVTSTIATETDADGAVSFTVLLGAADAGTATVKFIYEGANGTLEETTLNDDVVATATIAIGAAPASSATAAVSGSTGKFFVSATNAAAKKVVVKVAGKFAASFTGTAAKKSVAVKATKGSKKVTVFVGGKLVATKTVTVR